MCLLATTITIELMEHIILIWSEILILHDCMHTSIHLQNYLIHCIIEYRYVYNLYVVNDVLNILHFNHA